MQIYLRECRKDTDHTGNCGDKFKVGEKVLITNFTGCGDHSTGSTGVIASVTCDIYKLKDCGCLHIADWLEKIEDEPKSFWDYEPGSLIPWSALPKAHALPKDFFDPEILKQGYMAPIPQYQFYKNSYKPNESMTQKVSKTMFSIVKKIKDLKLKEEDRLLRKHEFEDEDGKITDATRELMHEEMEQERWDKRRLEIAADLKLVEQSEK